MLPFFLAASVVLIPFLFIATTLIASMKKEPYRKSLRYSVTSAALIFGISLLHAIQVDVSFLYSDTSNRSIGEFANVQYLVQQYTLGYFLTDLLRLSIAMIAIISVVGLVLSFSRKATIDEGQLGRNSVVIASTTLGICILLYAVMVSSGCCTISI